MKTTQIKIANLEFSARLEGSDYVQVEKRLKKSIFNTVLGTQIDDESVNIPPLGEMIIILSAACKTSGISEAKILKAVETHLGKGGTTIEIYEKLVELLSDSGFFGKTTDDSQEDAESDKVVELN
jgi:hypothetical protein